jgi:hypothetical protein
MDKEEKEIELPSKGGKGGVKKRAPSTGVTPSTPVPVAPGSAPRAPVKTITAPPHPAMFTSNATAPTVPAPAATPPATHTGLPQQVR